VDTSNVRVYGYRWVVLLAFMFINITIQILWICYAPVTVEASQYYHVSDLNIGLLAMIFMIVYVPLTIPAAWAIDTWGFKKAVGFGAILLGLFGLLRGIFTPNFALTLVFTIGLAIAQPFLLNAFPLGDSTRKSGTLRPVETCGWSVTRQSSRRSSS
jgi:MFS family permease